jgi:tetrahydromethanopterin S-methyltransferase subunit F
LLKSEPALWAAVFVVSFLPRVAFLLTQNLWFEDSAYLHHAFLITLGDQPFIDFPQAHLPIPEYLLAAWFSVAGATVRSTEVFSCLVAGCATLFTGMTVRRLYGRAAGVVAAAVVAAAPILMQYHVFARETLVWMLLAILVFLSVDAEGKLRPPRLTVFVALLVLVVACKLTAAMYLAPVVGALWVTGKHRRVVFRAVATAIAFFALLIAYYVVSSGHAVFQQMVGLHLLKGNNTTVRWAFSVIFGQYAHLVAIAFVALVLLAMGRKNTWLPFVVLGPSLLFFAGISPTVWDHNLVPWLLPLGLMTGIVVGEIPRFFVAREKGEAPGLIVPILAASSLCFAAASYPLVRWHGAGFDREELAAAAQSVQTASRITDRIYAPGYFAFASNRRLLVPYQEVAGLVRWQEQGSVSNPWQAAKVLEGKSWHQRYVELSPTWTPDVVHGVKSWSLAAAVRAPETPEWIDPFSSDFYLKHGLIRGFRSRSFEVFWPPPRPGS